MRVLTLCLSTFSVLVCAGAIAVLFFLPATATSIPFNTSGSLSAAVRSWSMIALLITGLASGGAVLFSLKEPGTPTLSRAAAVLTTVAAAIAIGDFIAARYAGLLGSHDVPWLNITVIAVATVFWINLGQKTRGT